MTESIDHEELADKLRPVVTGHKLVSVVGNVLTLDNGTRITIEGSSDCCAWGSASLGEIVDSEHVITSVSTNEGDEDGVHGTAQLFLLTDAGPAITIEQEWDESSGYYFYGLYLTVTEATL